MQRPSLAIVIPWRPSPGRERHLGLVTDTLIAVTGDVPVVLADSGHEGFSPGPSRNRGVAKADADVLVVCDADTLVEPQPLRAALESVQDGTVHVPYTRCRMLTPEASEMVLDGGAPHLAACSHEWQNSVGGICVLTRRTWQDFGGWDERFVGWGFEDAAWWCVASTLGGWVHHPGVIRHLHHLDGRRIGSPQWQRGKALCDRYTDARGDADAIRALVEEHTHARV